MVKQASKQKKNQAAYFKIARTNFFNQFHSIQLTKPYQTIKMDENQKISQNLVSFFPFSLTLHILLIVGMLLSHWSTNFGLGPVIIINRCYPHLSLLLVCLVISLEVHHHHPFFLFVVGHPCMIVYMVWMTRKDLEEIFYTKNNQMLLMMMMMRT